MNDPVAGSTGMPYVSRGRRRRWVLAMYLCMAAVAFWLTFGDNHWSVWLAVFGAVLYGASAAGSIGSELPTPRTTSDFGALGILVAFPLGSLPASAAAGTEPDPEPDE